MYYKRRPTPTCIIFQLVEYLNKWEVDLESLQTRREAKSILEFCRNPLYGNPRTKQTSRVKSNPLKCRLGRVPVKAEAAAACFGLFQLPLFMCVSLSLQREDGAAVDGRRRLQDLLLRDEPEPCSVLGLRFGADPDRPGHPAAGPPLQPGHQAQTGLSTDATTVPHGRNF